MPAARVATAFAWVLGGAAVNAHVHIKKALLLQPWSIPSAWHHAFGMVDAINL